MGRYLVRFGSFLGAQPARKEDEESLSGYNRWLNAQSFKLKRDFPDSWQDAIQSHAPSSRLVVLIHIFHADMVESLVQELASIPVPFDLIATNASGEIISRTDFNLVNLGNLIILKVENRGRDIWPMIQVVNAGLMDDYDLVFKIHTKKSEWREAHESLSGNGSDWLSDFTSSLLGTHKNVEQILNAFAENPDMGIVTPGKNLLGEKYWGSNKKNCSDLLRRIQINSINSNFEFPAGSIYWCRAFILQGLRALDLSERDFEDEGGQIDGTTAHAVERIIGILTHTAGFTHVAAEQIPRTAENSHWAIWGKTERQSSGVKCIAFYLPQFHSVQENDAWWGKGFTEWSNVTSAQSVHTGHIQPILPGELGFYDLSDSKIASRQFDLATMYGLEGFMYYYYWFAGKKLLNKPIEDHFASSSDGKFCIMWANENWTRRWDGGESNILISQNYEEQPAQLFIHEVLPLLKDPRYICEDEKPVLSVYRPTSIPNFDAVVKYWREIAQASGLKGLHIISVKFGENHTPSTPSEVVSEVVDAEMEFPPHNLPWARADLEGIFVDNRFKGRILDYTKLASDSISIHRSTHSAEEKPVYPGVLVNFDNTARRQWDSDLWIGSNPYSFRKWLRLSAILSATKANAGPILFINAWNEWAEGAVLEPTQRYGKTYLLAARSVLQF